MCHVRMCMCVCVCTFTYINKDLLEIHTQIDGEFCHPSARGAWQFFFLPEIAP